MTHTTSDTDSDQEYSGTDQSDVGIPAETPRFDSDSSEQPADTSAHRYLIGRSGPGRTWESENGGESAHE
jgi:hypothetical protein